MRMDVITAVRTDASRIDIGPGSPRLHSHVSIPIALNIDKEPATSFSMASPFSAIELFLLARMETD
jgi:hypothetical protein